MPVYIRKHPLEIPPPSEKDWIKKDEEENFFLQDPDQIFDSLPQPFRMINKLVTLVFEQAWEIIEKKEALREAQTLKVQPKLYLPTAEFQVMGRANCLAASGQHVFVGLSTGLAVFSMPNCKRVCAWESARLEICAIRTSNLGNETHLFVTVDEMGLARLFYFYKDSLLLIKVLNEVEEISKRNTCVEAELSQRGDYAGILLQGNTEAWLEIYRLPKDSWLKETDHAQAAAVVSSFRERRFSQASTKSLELPGEGSAETESPMSANRVETKLSPPVLLLKVRSPKPLTGSTFKSPLEALMKIDDGSVIGLGQNHVIKDYQWEQQDAIFRSTFQKHLERESEPDSKEEKPSHAVFHFLLPGRILQIGPEIKAQPDVPTGITVHWNGSHNLCLYLLTRPSKEKMDAELKPDTVWPCAAPITCSAVTSCSSYMALACEDGTITVWDRSLGFPLAVTALPEGCLSRTIHFLQTSTAPTDQLPRPKVQLLVLCTDGSLHLVIISGPRESRTVLLADRSEDPDQTISAVAPIPALPGAVLVFSWDGTVCLTDTATPRPVCHFITPPSHTVASPWQPVFTVDTTNHGLLLRGDEQQQQAGPRTQTKDKQSSIFLFNFDSYLSMEVFPAVPEPPPESLQHLPWVERCDIFFRDRLQRLSGLSQQVPKCWSQLRKHAAALQRESRKK
ncbi:WD repeat-containing protein 93 [Caretta caretta]|uniref:WD repeat-containing protein 93 n=1 Tax=Caretta caretta TaxID=8467 RepID=UPI002094B37E|nr:WD repeat-containing protein 93 [Caretta caretta]